MLPRASSSEVSATARSRFSRIIRSATSDRPSWCGLQSSDTYPSIACVMASMPVDAAIADGSVRVDSGSRIASRGNSGKSAISSLTLFSWSLTMAPIDTSDPVPAVVGMQASGAIGSGAPIPSSARGIRKKPSCSRAEPPWVNSASAILAVSITEPPPTARNESAPAALASSAHRSQTSVDESWGTSSKIPATSRPPSSIPGDHLVDQAGAADHAVGDHEYAVGALLGQLEAGARQEVASRDHAGWPEPPGRSP